MVRALVLKHLITKIGVMLT